VATSLVPTKPLAPEIATRIFASESGAAPEDDEAEEDALSPANAVTCAVPRPTRGFVAVRRDASDARETREENEAATTCRRLAGRAVRPHESVAATPWSRRAWPRAPAISHAATRDRSSRADARATHGAIARDATETQVIFVCGGGTTMELASSVRVSRLRARWYD
jgi:hypothetical protein